jgi:tetratricopeptide (TPR) repeat protein
MKMQFLASLNHSGVVTFHHHFQHEGKLHLVMEYCPGGSLRQRLEEGPLPQEQAIEWIRCLADTLGFVHARGVVHHDIKPDNILFGPDDSLKIGDFGIANQLGGTLFYLAPELHLGPVSEKDQRVDVYALGLTLLELLLGSLPFDGLARHEILARKQIRDFVPLTLNSWLREVLFKAIQPNPELRFQNMAEFKEAIETHHVRYVVDANRVRAHALAMEAERLMGQHRLASASKLVDQALHYGKGSVPARVVAGRYNLLIGRVEKAAEYFGEAIRLNPRAQIQKELAWLALERGDYSYAISMLNDHLQRHSSDYEAANLLVQCFYDLGRFQYARQLCEMMLKTHPKNACFSNNRYISSLLETGDSGSTPEELGTRDMANPFVQYNRRMVGLDPEDLKRKLLFQDHRFGDPGLTRSSNTLVLRSGAESATFNDPIVTIGRDPTNAYVIEQTDVSRWHCIVLNFRGDVWLYDLNSTHGTAVDGQRLNKRIRIDGVHEIKASGAALTIVSEEGRLV